jgi:hypothetical protein
MADFPVAAYTGAVPASQTATLQVPHQVLAAVDFTDK